MSKTSLSDAELVTAVRSRAESEGVSPQDWLRAHLSSTSDEDADQPKANDAKQPRTAFDELNERGLIGCIDGPPDLSTNPKYLEGLGRDG